MRERTEERFGNQALNFALFYNHKTSIQFELFNNYFYIERFLPAYDGVKLSIDFVFYDADRLFRTPGEIGTAQTRCKKLI